MNQLRLFFCTLLLGLGTLLPAQNDTTVIRLDTVPPVEVDTLSKISFPDSTIVVPVMRKGRIGRFFTNNYPDPGKAALFSLIVPGAGQAYNKKWWKLPIVYAGLGTLLYFAFDNTNEYRDARDAFRAIVDEDPNTQPQGKFATGDAVSIKSYRDTYRRYMEQNWLWTGVAYLAVAADAYVDAHLYRFDVSEDLSFRPTLAPAPGGAASLGLGVRLSLGRHNSPGGIGVVP
jgi:hypothetical protein